MDCNETFERIATREVILEKKLEEAYVKTEDLVCFDEYDLGDIFSGLGRGFDLLTRMFYANMYDVNLDKMRFKSMIGGGKIVVNRDFISELTDIPLDRDFVLEFLSANSIIAIHLSRLGEEWVLWASGEFGFLTRSDAVSTGSSIMPQKKNPDPMELVRGKSARVVGDLVTLLVLCKGLPQAYNRDLHNIPFRTSHDIVGRSVAMCVSKKCELQDLSLDELKRLSPIFEQFVYLIIQAKELGLFHGSMVAFWQLRVF
ncbi:argininosuccinate lyase, chloroplastic-like [Papaver somniferum]|uniref:argininosuccinate lyase, chloroplastic-like n=1 Tax=Papaver somniferum TaxID=3469 RepID=UPI000E6FCDA5|nr:argininosuccinate lyase, chloroplastic-like [Papaver somniferum]